MEIHLRSIFRTSRVVGMTVKTPDNKRLGVIEDIAIDLKSGSVAYAVLSFGGLFGFADKFFAVPWEEFSLDNDEKGHFFTIDTSKEKLKQLPGFDKEDWPDLANSDWDEQVDEHHQRGATERADNPTDV